MVQHGAPVLVDSLSKPARITTLRRNLGGPRAPDAAGHFVEDFLQNLVDQDPSVLPIEAIEPGFSGMRAVCQELRLKSSSGVLRVDNLLANEAGRLCIVECKLWRNSEAEREVVAQILDYASELASMSYERLLDAVRKARGASEGDPLVEAVLGAEPDEEVRIAFIDGVSRSLRSGSFLLLIVGDGIRPTVRRIAEMLQKRAHLGFAFGLVEMAIYGEAGEGGRYYVQSRVLARTDIVRRTVFIPSPDPMSQTEGLTISGVSLPGKPESITEHEFYGELAKAKSEYPEAVRQFAEACRYLGCDPELRRKLVIYVDEPSGRFNIGTIAKDGLVEVYGSSTRDAQFDKPIIRNYLEKLANLLPNAAVDSKDHLLVNGKARIPLELLLAHKEAWLAAIGELLDSLRSIGDGRG